MLRRLPMFAAALLVVVIVVGSLTSWGVHMATAAPPAGFQNVTVIGGLTQTTVIATPFLQLTNINIDQGERGLVGLVLDPSYTTNSYYYVFYTANSPLRD